VNTVNGNYSVKSCFSLKDRFALGKKEGVEYWALNLNVGCLNKS